MYPSSHCGYPTTTAYLLRKHIRMYHIKERYHCDLCEYATTIVEHLTVHFN